MMESLNERIFGNWLTMISRTRSHDADKVRRIVRDTADDLPQQNMRLHAYCMLCEQVDDIAWAERDRARHPEFYE